MITIRELCLLHERDPAGTPRLRLSEIFEGQAGPLTWSDLAELLHGGSHYRQFLNVFVDNGRLDREKQEFGLAAFDFLVRRREQGPRGVTIAVYNSVWDVVWDYHMLAQDDRYIFRGQVDSRWPLTSSLFRADAGLPPDLSTLVGRIQETEEFTEALRARALELVDNELTDEELLAVAQHYGFPTTLLDFTRSLRIAAFFASRRLQSETIGIIYYMRADRAELAKDGDIEAQLTFGQFSLLDAARLHVGDLHVVQPQLRDPDNRIARQQGVFLAGYHVHDLKEVAIDRLRFRQQPGETFQDRARGITEAMLLPPDSPIQELADATRTTTERRRPRGLNAGLAAARLPPNPVIGSDGANLFTHVRAAGKFFNELRQSLDGERINELARIFDEYFAAARVNADVGEALEPTSSTPAVIPIAVAVKKLAELTGTDSDRLWATIFAELRPGPADSIYGEPRGAPLNPSTADERLALACGLFLAAWEHLQHVGGTKARGLTLSASSVLRGHGLLPDLT